MKEDLLRICDWNSNKILFKSNLMFWFHLEEIEIFFYFFLFYLTCEEVTEAIYEKNEISINIQFHLTSRMELNIIGVLISDDIAETSLACLFLIYIKESK